MKLPSDMKYVRVLLGVGLVLLLVNLLKPNYWVLASKDVLFTLASLGALVNVARMSGSTKEKVATKGLGIALWIVLLVVSVLSLYARSTSFKLRHEYTIKIVQILTAVSAYSAIMFHGNVAGVSK